MRNSFRWLKAKNLLKFHKNFISLSAISLLLAPRARWVHSTVSGFHHIFFMMIPRRAKRALRKQQTAKYSEQIRRKALNWAQLLWRESIAHIKHEKFMRRYFHSRSSNTFLLLLGELSYVIQQNGSKKFIDMRSCVRKIVARLIQFVVSPPRQQCSWSLLSPRQIDDDNHFANFLHCCGREQLELNDNFAGRHLTRYI